MATARMGAKLVAGGLVLLGSAAAAEAAPTTAQMLGFKPKQEGVVITTPTAEELAKCKVELVKATRGSGWMLKDEKGDLLRRYMDTNGDNKIDVWSYYHKGLEVYRELDTNFNDKVDQYRWLHSAGSRWGHDPVEDGKIKGWRVISAEEVSQEVLQALVKRDFAKLQAVLMTEADIKALELPTAEAERIRASLRKAPAKFQETLSKLSTLSDKARWDHLELAVPQCVPADALTGKQDLVRYTSALLLYQHGDDKGMQEAKALKLGEMIQVGTAWKLIDAPEPGSLLRGEEGPMASETLIVSKEVEEILKQLGEHDKAAPGPNAGPADLHRHNVKRADLLEKLVAQKELKPEDRDQWLRQVADCLSVAAQNSPNGDKSTYQRLVTLKDKIAKDQPESGTAAYVSYCEIMADYNLRISTDDGVKLQKEFLDKLEKFVQDYPKAENAPEALMQLGMISELMNEEGPAKKWYEMFAKNYPNHPQAAKMEGAKRRLESTGKDMELAGGTLAGSAFDVKSLKGKVVVVYYWASWNGQCATDLEKLKALHGTHAAKGLEVVCVNLDDASASAKSFLQGKTAPAVHLHEQGGMASKLSEHYGIQVLPTMFLIGKDGKVLSHTIQITTVEEEAKKALN
ncbi:MAG: redoxin domain-containing protein [Planctomycetia bacterium]|nr:redoxin domain-containing protein [Planctomycetia bacterium]